MKLYNNGVYLVNGNQKAIKGYTYFYVLALAVGAYIPINLVWNIADILNALMALPNLIALLYLSPVVINDTRKYFKTKIPTS